MNQQAMLKKLKKMQDEMMQTQKDIDQTIFSASAGGVVEVSVLGTKELSAVKIADDFEAEGKEDYEMLSEMVVAACNQAYKDIDRTTKEKMGKYEAMFGGMNPFA